MRARRTIQVLMMALTVSFVLTVAAAQQGAKKAHTLRGKIEAVNESTKSLTVNHETVPGWMDAMTMAYAVDKVEVLKKVKVGDQIKATVYDGDYTLHDIQVVPPEKPKK